MKAALGVIWIYCALCLFLPLPLAGWGATLFWLLIVAHAVECAIFLPTLREAPGGLGHNLVQTMLFGVVHVQPLRQAGQKSGE